MAAAVASAGAGLKLGPAPAGAAAAEREATVTRLLEGQQASALPERATDPDSEFDVEWEARILWRLRPEPGMRRGPKVRMGEFTVSPGLPNDVVKRIFRQNLGRMRLCYEQQLAKNPKLEGKVKMDFTITLEGNVQGLRASPDTLKDAPLLACLGRAMDEDVTFPQPEAGAPVTVSVPVLFAP